MKRNDLSRCLVAFDQNSTLVAVVELSAKSWLIAGLVPGLARQPLKKQAADEEALLGLLQRWAREAVKAGCNIERLVVAFEAGRDGFWLARWLLARGIEAYVIHPTSVAVSREHRRAVAGEHDGGDRPRHGAAGSHPRPDQGARDPAAGTASPGTNGRNSSHDADAGAGPGGRA